MKTSLKLIVVGLMAFAMAYTISRTLKKNPPPPEVVQPAWTKSLPNAVTVFCFRGEKQSRRDKAVEKETYNLLMESFASEMKQGRLVWRVVNYEKPEDEATKRLVAHLVKEFGLSSSCVMLIDGRERRWGDCKSFSSATWDMVENDLPNYTDFMVAHIRDMLK